MVYRRRFHNRADYVSVIIGYAEGELATNPLSNLMRCLTYNISGGHEYWGDSASAVYKSPATLDEALLALELRQVLETGIQNQLLHLQHIVRANTVERGVFGFRMDFGVFYHYAQRLAHRNVLEALRMKIVGNKITLQATGMSLVEYLYQDCHRGQVSEEDICKDL